MTEGTVTAEGPQTIMVNSFEGSENPVEQQQQQQEPAKEGDNNNGAAQNEQPAPEPAPSVDYNAYIKEQFGFDDVDSLKTKLGVYKELEEKSTQAPAEAAFKFENETSEKIFNALKAGKADEAYQYLHDNNVLSRLSNLTIDGVNPAKEIIKAELQYKHKDLSADEISDIFEEKYSYPEKPEQGDDQTDEEYTAQLDKWKGKCEAVDKKIIREAKLAKPELAKLHSQLVLPDIPSVSSQKDIQAAQEDLARQQEGLEKAKEKFKEVLEPALTSFNGFNVSVKDESGELPISFGVTNEDKTSLKPIVESLSSNFDYFGERWIDENGAYKMETVIRDIFLLENQGKILQKIANESASLALEKHIKQQANIDLNKNVPHGTITPPNGAEMYKKQADAIWGIN